MKLIYGAVCTVVAGAATVLMSAPQVSAAAADAPVATAAKKQVRQATEKQEIVNVLLARGASFERADAIASEDLAGEAMLAAAAAPPSCVSATYSNPAGPYQDVKVKNGCAVSVRVKVIWAYATDSACHSIASGSSWTDHHLNQWGADRYDGIVSC